MRALIGPFLVMSSAAIPFAGQAEEPCYKPRFGNNPTSAETRACRLNAVVDEWLAERGIETEWWLQTYEGVGAIFDNQALFDVRRIKPWARVEVYYVLGKNESIAAAELIRFRPGYFGDLETVLRSQARAIVCDTLGSDEQAFIASGGEIEYRVGLKPSVVDFRTPDWFVRIDFSQSSCEAP